MTDVLEFPKKPVPAPQKPREPHFINIQIPAFFPLERLAGLFRTVGYRLHLCPDGTIRMLPHDGTASRGPRRAWTKPGVGLPHQRFAARLREAREKLRAD